ncbi:multiple C2 and transmembrane domain-containing protein isoform X2 [Odontomachus brunneus]|uniref:multiple C2 and transmembrane domain-containing protein isoform X2 n=1 Tax=Odontomachus brunneus TaxID=486640 RepID=UPI0013F1E105|nr:multiple C2 and transmembrane domain-containing protein isoform X2 [Odontomachus brunneus]
MDTIQETDLVGTKPRTGSEPNIVPEMDATPSRNLVDDISKFETASATRVMSNVDTPIRKLQRKPHVNRQRRYPVTTAASKHDTSIKKLEQNVDETESDSDGDSEGLSVAVNSPAIEQAIEEATKIETTKTTEEGPSSTEGVSLTKEKTSSTLSEKPKLDRVSTKDGRWKEEELSRMQKKKTKDSLKDFIERKIELMERIVEDRVERISSKIREENMERHPWLQPIDTWISDHRKPTTSYTLVTHQGDDEQDIASKSTYNCETIEENEEPRADGKTAEHPQPSRGTSSSRSNRLELASLIAQSKKQKVVPTLRVEYRDEDVTIDVSNDSTGVAEARETKRHNNDLLDKLKDNVKEKMEDIHRYFQRTNRLADVNRRLKSQIWSSVVTIVLVEAKNLLPMDIDGLSDPYVKFRLGTEKYKSKVVNKTLNPVWLEQFDLHLYEDPYLGQELEVTVWDRDRSHNDDLMGRTVIDLAALERETTHRLWRELEDGSGNIFLLLTISGTTASETISDLAAHEDTPLERVQLIQRYSILNTLQRVRDVGHLTVKVYRAQGLAAADLGGKSDPFCVLELVNARLQTQTEYKTLAPNWQKIFTFNVKDINSVLEVTVYDEDRDHKVEFLGKVAIPLLKIRNGEKRWYALKDKKLRGRAKGNCPQILLEMTVMWNIFRACARTLNPKEKKYMEPEVKFKRQVFLRNVLRLKAIIVIFIDIGKYIQSCWEWESKMRSVFALVIFIFGCYYFEPYMIPAVALLILLKYYLLSGERSGFNHWICGQVAVVTGAPLIYATSQFQDHAEIGSDDCPLTPGDDDDDDDDKDKEEKKSLKERLQAIQEVTQTVQNSIGYIASLCERVKNLFNFTIPYLSYLAMILAIIGAVVLYFIPVRYLILAWGVNKFSRKILRPHSVPNNELLDLISRVPDDEELLNYRELKPVPTADCEKGGISGSPGANTTRREQRKRHKVA